MNFLFMWKGTHMLAGAFEETDNIGQRGTWGETEQM